MRASWWVKERAAVAPLPEREGVAERVYGKLWQYEDAAEVKVTLLTGGCVMLFLVAAGFCVLFLRLHLFGEPAKTLVQVVQVEADKSITFVGPPQPVLQWTPPESAYRTVVTNWVRNFYWRGGPQVSMNQQWVVWHTCGPARPHLEALQKQEKVFDPTHRVVQVTIKAVHKTPAPRQFQVVWEEFETYNTASPKHANYSAVFTVARMQAHRRDTEWFHWNAAAICIDGFSAKEAL